MTTALGGQRSCYATACAWGGVAAYRPRWPTYGMTYWLFSFSFIKQLADIQQQKNEQYFTRGGKSTEMPNCTNHDSLFTLLQQRLPTHSPAVYIYRQPGHRNDGQKPSHNRNDATHRHRGDAWPGGGSGGAPVTRLICHRPPTTPAPRRRRVNCVNQHPPQRSLGGITVAAIFTAAQPRSPETTGIGNFFSLPFY